MSAAVTRLGIPRKNILTLFGSQATYEGVAKAFDCLSRRLCPDSALIIYFNGHGILLPEGSGSGHPEYVFVLWSEEFPFAGLYAVLAHVWMNDLEFSKRVKKLPGKAKLVIADTCHAVGVGQDLLPKGMKIDYGLEDAALMAAAEAGQSAISTQNHALFTMALVTAMDSGARNLMEAFQMAKTATMKESRVMCPHLTQRTSKGKCTEQNPTLEDPDSIVPLFKIKSGRFFPRICGFICNQNRHVIR